MSTAETNARITNTMIQRPKTPTCPPRATPGASRFREHLDDSPPINSSLDAHRSWEYVKVATRVDSPMDTYHSREPLEVDVGVISPVLSTRQAPLSSPRAVPSKDGQHSEDSCMGPVTKVFNRLLTGPLKRMKLMKLRVLSPTTVKTGTISPITEQPVSRETMVMPQPPQPARIGPGQQYDTRPVGPHHHFLYLARRAKHIPLDHCPDGGAEGYFGTLQPETVQRQHANHSTAGGFIYREHLHQRALPPRSPAPLPSVQQRRQSRERDPLIPLEDNDVQDMLAHLATVEDTNARHSLSSYNTNAEAGDGDQNKPGEMIELVSDARRATRRAIVAASSIGSSRDHVMSQNKLGRGVAQVRPATHRKDLSSCFSDCDEEDTKARHQDIPMVRPASRQIDLSDCFSDSDQDDTTTGREIPGVRPVRRRMALSDTCSDSDDRAVSASSSDPIGSVSDSEFDGSWLGIIAKLGPVNRRRSLSSCFSVGSFASDDETAVEEELQQPNSSTKQQFLHPSCDSSECVSTLHNDASPKETLAFRYMKKGEYTLLRNPNLTIKIPRVDSGYAMYESPRLDPGDPPLPLSPRPTYLYAVNASPLPSPPDCHVGLQDVPYVEDPGWLNDWRDSSDLIFTSEDQAHRARWAHLWEDPYVEPIDQSLFADFDGDFNDKFVAVSRWSNQVLQDRFLRENEDGEAFVPRSAITSYLKASLARRFCSF